MCLWHNKSSEPHLNVRLPLSNSAPHSSWWLLLISCIPGPHHYHHHYPPLLLNTVLSRASQFEEGRVCMIRTKLTRLRCDANIIQPLSLYTFYGGQGILMTSGLVSLSLSLLHPLLSVYHASEAEQGATKNGSRSDDSIGYTPRLYVHHWGLWLTWRTVINMEMCD